MNFQETMAELDTLGTEQNRKTYRNHGVRGAQFGLSFANLDKLAKQLKKNQALAEQLWRSDNQDARLLACRIADPRQISRATLESWAQELDNYIITDAFSGLAAQTAHAHELMEEWNGEAAEWTSAAGWNILSYLALKDASLPDGFFEPYLEIIQASIHTRANRTRYAMNNALIAIGVRNSQLKAKAMLIAIAIGLVNVDHGLTSCETPDASSYIQKTWAYKEKKAKK